MNKEKNKKSESKPLANSWPSASELDIDLDLILGAPDLALRETANNLLMKLRGEGIEDRFPLYIYFVAGTYAAARINTNKPLALISNIKEFLAPAKPETQGQIIDMVICMLQEGADNSLQILHLLDYRNSISPYITELQTEIDEFTEEMQPFDFKSLSTELEGKSERERHIILCNRLLLLRTRIIEMDEDEASYILNSGFMQHIMVLMDQMSFNTSMDIASKPLLTPRRLCLIAYYRHTTKKNSDTYQLHTDLLRNICTELNMAEPARQSWKNITEAITRKSKNLPADVEVIRSHLENFPEALALAVKEAEEVL